MDLRWTQAGQITPRRPNTTWRRTAVAELQEMGHTWGEVQHVAPLPGAVEASRHRLLPHLRRRVVISVQCKRSYFFKRFSCNHRGAYGAIMINHNGLPS